MKKKKNIYQAIQKNKRQQNMNPIAITSYQLYVSY